MARQAAILTGRRKEAIARVSLLPVTDGKPMIVTINGREFDKYFPNELHREDVVRPLRTAGQYGSYSIRANVQGGGTTGQAGAVRLGVARALVDISEEFKSALRKDGLMTRDPRMVERKKSGQPKARKRFQFSKR